MGVAATTRPSKCLHLDQQVHIFVFNRQQSSKEQTMASRCKGELGCARSGDVAMEMAGWNALSEFVMAMSASGEDGP